MKQFIFGAVSGALLVALGVWLSAGHDATPSTATAVVARALDQTSSPPRVEETPKAEQIAASVASISDAPSQPQVKRKPKLGEDHRAPSTASLPNNVAQIQLSAAHAQLL